MDLTSPACVSFNRSRSTTNENAHRSHVIASEGSMYMSTESRLDKIAVCSSMEMFSLITICDVGVPTNKII